MYCYRVFSIAVIKHYSERLWNPAATKKKLKPKGEWVHELVTYTCISGFIALEGANAYSPNLSGGKWRET